MLKQVNRAAGFERRRNAVCANWLHVTSSQMAHTGVSLAGGMADCESIQLCKNVSRVAVSVMKGNYNHFFIPNEEYDLIREWL